jgi:hypothetical protein
MQRNLYGARKRPFFVATPMAAMRMQVGLSRELGSIHGTALYSLGA